MYKINFDKIKQSCEHSGAFQGYDWFHPEHKIKGIYWHTEELLPTTQNYNSLNDTLRLHEAEEKWQYAPLVAIDESVEDHMTQIIFILKEEFTTAYSGFPNTTSGFMGWKPFSKDFLTKICTERHAPIYKAWDNGPEFIADFPRRIDQFIECYCDLQ